MLRSIFAAVGAALMSAFRFFGRVLSAPLRMFGGVTVAPEVPMPQPYVAEATPSHSQVYEDIALIVMSWCADCLIADKRQPLPPKLSRDLLSWLPGLSRHECHEVMNADRMAVSAHLMGIFAIPGVRAVQYLPVETWPPGTPLEPSPEFSANVAPKPDLPRLA